MAHSGFGNGLIASGPAPEYREALMLYGQFVGDWTTETVAYLPNGSNETSQWDVRFQWVLEGRAIQDLWIMPPRSKGSVSWHEPGNRYSTTLRVYDPKIDAWHIVWVNPPSGAIVTQVGRRVGDEFVQLGNVEPDGEVSRWVYRDISRNSFRWCNERSPDQGATWRLVQEMHARRLV